MFNISLKKIFKYKIRRFTESKYDSSIDSNFEFVKDLREKGFYKRKSFYKDNVLAQNIINDYDNISKDFLSEKANTLFTKEGRYNYRIYITEKFNKSLLLEYANQKIFFENFEQYFGLKPHVRFISIWLDYPTKNEEEKNSQLFHRDYDDVFLVKTFLCLTNINENNGPFQFMPTSHIDPWKKNINFYLKKNKIVNMTANKGDLYMADTNGFHKGKKLLSGFRVLLNVHYASDNPMAEPPIQIVN